MEDTADRLLVIGRGRLIAETGIAEFIESGTRAAVRVVSPQADALAGVLTQAGAEVSQLSGDEMTVTGLPAARIGDLAADRRIRLHELTPQRARLEAAFMQLTHDSAEHVGRAVP
jgi:ABC-2 type transport system ATP-binding protein